MKITNEFIFIWTNSINWTLYRYPSLFLPHLMLYLVMPQNLVKHSKNTLSFKQRYTNWNRPFNLVHTMVTSTKWISVCVVTFDEMRYILLVLYCVLYIRYTKTLTNYLFFFSLLWAIFLLKWLLFSILLYEYV